MLGEIVAELRSAPVGNVWNTTTQAFEAPTSASTAAAKAFVDGAVAEVVKAIGPVNLLGILTITEAKIQAAANAIVVLARVYINATTKP